MTEELEKVITETIETLILENMQRPSFTFRRIENLAKAWNEYVDANKNIPLEQQVIPKIAEAIKEIVWMARRYADGRQTFSARSFNDAYDVLRDVFGEGIEFTKYKDLTLTEDGAFFPYAQDGGDRKYFDAVRDRKYSNFSE